MSVAFTRRMSAIGLLICGFVLTAVAQFFVDGQTALLIWSIALAIGAIGIVLLLQSTNPQARELEDQRAQIDKARAELKSREQAARELKDSLQVEFDRLNRELIDRERHLANQFSRMQEWLEFPEADPQQIPEIPPAMIDQDHRVLEILEDESRQLFDRILKNEYSQDGRFQIEKLRDEMLQLATRVAQVYRPEVEHPLLETSPEAILRASSRISLHLLVLLDGLPLDMKRHNIGDLYQYVRSAVTAYGAYRKAEPYLGFLNKGMYVGRFVAGSNPLALGAWWLATQLGKEGGKALARKWLNEQAIRMLHELVRIVGFEFANLYGPGFRFRDSQWVLGAELTEIASHFPVSRESLTASLREISRLELRSEYDRVYFYRCVAAGKPAMKRLAEIEAMTPSQRESIVQRLEHFVQEHVHGVDSNRLDRWKTSVEERFQVQVRLDTPNTRKSGISQSALVRSLVEFLLLFKHVEPESIQPSIGSCSTVSGMPPEELLEIIDATQQSVPEKFAPADLDPVDQRVEAYLLDLIRLAVRVEPVEPYIEEYVRELAHFYRVPSDDTNKMLQNTYVEWISSVLPEDTPRPPAHVARAIRFSGLADDLRRVYAKTRIHANGLEDSSACLCVESNALRLLSTAAPFTELWSTRTPVRAERIHGYLIDDLRILPGTAIRASGAEMDQGDSQAESRTQHEPLQWIDVAGSLGTSFDRTFAELIHHSLIKLEPTTSS